MAFLGTNQPQQQSQLSQSTQQPPPVMQNPLAKLYGAYNAAHGAYTLGRYGADALSSSAPSLTAPTVAPGMEAVGTAMDGTTIYAPVGDSVLAGNAAPTLLGSETLASALPPLAVAAIGAYTANKGVDAWNKGKGNGAWDGFNDGLQAAGPLKYVPLLGQVPAIAGMISGMLGHKSTAQFEREADAKASQINPDYAAFKAQADANRANMPQSKYNQTHNISDLGVDDITGAQVFAQKYKDWFQKPEEERNSIAQQLLDAHAIDDKHGLITADFSKVPGSTVATPSSSGGGLPIVNLPGKLPASSLPAAISAIDSAGAEDIPIDNGMDPVQFKKLLDNFGKKK